MVVFLIQAEVILATLFLIHMVYKYQSQPSIRRLKSIIVLFLLEIVFYITIGLVIFFDAVRDMETQEW